jgi:hypothetical protein
VRDVSFDRIAAEYDATRGGIERARDAARDVAAHLLSDGQWQAHVVPAIEALRAMPQPDRPRERRARMTVSVLEAG